MNIIMKKYKSSGLLLIQHFLGLFVACFFNIFLVFQTEMVDIVAGSIPGDYDINTNQIKLICNLGLVNDKTYKKSNQVNSNMHKHQIKSLAIGRFVFQLF